MFDFTESFINKVIKEYHKRWENNPTHTEFYNEAVFREWCRKYNVVGWYTKGYLSWKKLFNIHNKRGINDFTPYEDHISLFRTASGELIFTSQPYGKISAAEFENIKKWCSERGLRVDNKPELSWYCPGTTSLLQYTIV